MATLIKDRTLRLRVSSRDDERLRAAASRCEQTLTDFLLEPALDRADEVLGKIDYTWLGREQFENMLVVLHEPVAVIPELVELLAEPRMFERA
ncbi:MAG: DUF1778 domain-containing protein [Promicromonosporaceae bacterium]|nr:DUF1778 domain-containing protein [Promicromonosporaceae bacterium]